MVRNLTLTSFTVQRNSLSALVNRKAATSKTTTINEQFGQKFKVDTVVLTNIMAGIEAKFHKCEMIYQAYFEYIDHAVLAGNAATLPIQMDCTFTDGTASFQEIFSCDDKALYRDLIDINFQTFILMTASIYENLVHLTEIICKKVIVFIDSKKPISTPLHDFLEYLKLLVSLGYRKTNDLDACLTTFAPYFQSYLITINKLRNSFIHGYSRNLASDGSNYKVTTFDTASFAAGSPLLNIDIFSKDVLENTGNFISALYPALEQSIRHHTKKVPI